MNPTIEWGNLHDKVNRPVITKEMARKAIIDAATDSRSDLPIVRFIFACHDAGESLESIDVSKEYDFDTVNAFGVIKAQNIFEPFFDKLKYWLQRELMKANPQYSDPSHAPVNTFFYHYLDVYTTDIIRDNFLILDKWFSFEEWADMLFNGAKYYDCRPNNETIAYKMN